MADIEYGYVRTLANTPFDDAVARVTAALKEEGFGVLTQIDVQATLKAKIGADFRKYVILGACNPQLAHRGLQAEEQLGLILPCNVVVQERDGDSVVSIVDPKAMFLTVKNPDLGEMVEDVDARVKRVLAAL